MLIRRSHYIWTLTVISTLIIDTRCMKIACRSKRSVADHFDMLLNLYKVNPLRYSTIFKEFSNRMLVPNTGVKEVGAMHFDTNESTRERLVRTKVNLKQIEEAIHVTQPHKELGPPSYMVSDVAPETFSAGLTLEHFDKRKLLNAKKDEFFFDNLLGHISSNEMEDKMLVTDAVNEPKAYSNIKPFIDKIFDEIPSKKSFNNVVSVHIKDELNKIEDAEKDVIVL